MEILNRLFIGFQVFMVALYIGFGAYMLISTSLKLKYDPLMINIFGIVMILYGIVRGYQVYNKLIEKSHEKSN